MEDKTNAMQHFDEFAKGRLNIHQAELSTRYENETIDKETLEKAYGEHTKIFSQELDEKINELSFGQNDQWLHTELQNQKQGYLSKLNYNQSKN